MVLIARSFDVPVEKANPIYIWLLRWRNIITISSVLSRFEVHENARKGVFQATVGHVAVYCSPSATAFTCTETTTTAILSPLDATRNSLNGNGTRITPRGIRNCARNNGRVVSPIYSLLPFLVRVSRCATSLFLWLSTSISSRFVWVHP